MTEISDKRLENEIEDFNAAMVPFGSLDVRAAVETALEGGHDGDWAAEQIEEFMDSTGITKLSEIDPVYVIYDSLLQEARNDIDTLTGKDILNDTEHQVEVCGNCVCTTLDYSEEAKAELLEVLKEVPEEDKTPAIKWLKSELE